jgi:hypothetical protein
MVRLQRIAEDSHLTEIGFISDTDGLRFRYESIQISGSSSNPSIRKYRWYSSYWDRVSDAAEDEEILTKFVESCISFTPALVPHPPHTIFLEAIESLRSVFDLIARVDMSLYQNFGVEWTRLVWTIIAVFRLIHSAITFSLSDRSIVEQLSRFGQYFEILCFRSKELSSSGKDGGPPDMFLLFDSVLRVVREKYAKMIGTLSDVSTESSPSSFGSSAKSFAALCPMMNGGVRGTDYWDAYSTSTMQSPFSVEQISQFPQMGNWMLWDPMVNEKTVEENGRS